MSEKHNSQLEGGTYEIIQTRLQKHKNELIERLNTLNEARKNVFGSVETKLIANDRINTSNSCVARDIVALGNRTIFGYNVHFGLRTEIQLSDVFSEYIFKDGRFQEQPLVLLKDEAFVNDFQNLYKYYRSTFFTKFSIIGNYLHMVFQINDKPDNVKTFKWLINENSIQYIDNRSDHEYKFPKQHEFIWEETNFEMHRNGLHPHVSILDKVFVETVGGDLTIKIEDNTNDGKGIYRESVEHKDQTLEDGKYIYADLGNLTVLGITPYQETTRYFVYNHKVQEVERIQSIEDCAVLLPDNHGLIFPAGYYLQTGEFKLFEKSISNVKFQQKIIAPNGEDFLYVFYEANKGDYVLMNYNIIEQGMNTPIICNGFTLLESGELCYFKAEKDASKHHVVQIWQTPYSKEVQINEEHADSLLFKIGNKDIVKAMAECQEIVTLLNKEDSYDGLYADISKQSGDILDSYYWIKDTETKNLDLPLIELRSTANSAIDEYQKVVELKKGALIASEEVETMVSELFDRIKHSSFKQIDDFVVVLNGLRTAQGSVISLKDIRYSDSEKITVLTNDISENYDQISTRCVEFLLDDKALLPYHENIIKKNKALGAINRVVEGKNLKKEINQTASDLELLIEIINNLKIEDTSHSTKIIDNISLLFSEINQLKAGLKKKINSFNIAENQADFVAQLKLLDQSIINYLDIANTPEQCDEFLTKLSIQLEELEGKFADFEDFIAQIIDKREEIYSAFETRKGALVDTKNKKSIALYNAAERILKSISKKAETLEDNPSINGYFASDLMVTKTFDIIQQLKDLQENGKAESLESNLKSLKEETVRKLKDKKDLYEDGENIIRLGNHKFGVNKQPLDLNIVVKEDNLYFHLAGTEFYELVENDILNSSRAIWDQELISENDEVYRAEYLAYKLYREGHSLELLKLTDAEILSFVRSQASSNYAEGYVKGVHDEDAKLILSLLLKTEDSLGLLKYEPSVRAIAQLFWLALSEEDKVKLNLKLKAAGKVMHVFPDSHSYQSVEAALFKQLELFSANWPLNNLKLKDIVDYLFEELCHKDTFIISGNAIEIRDAFTLFLKENNQWDVFETSVANQLLLLDKVQLLGQWVSSFISLKNLDSFYLDEVVVLLLTKQEPNQKVNHIPAESILVGLRGSHNVIKNDAYNFLYHSFVSRLFKYTEAISSAFLNFKNAKKEVLSFKKEKMKLEEFKPKVLSSFVRNKLIDEVYLPLFGDNLSKQLGTAGESKRTDRMGMLLLVSPPGYGKTTLMEYVSERLGLVFMKINGPAIGHNITSVDPEVASNSASRQELEKLNLAFEMGNNVMLYLDDIQHCNTEFLQKFISLADGQRKIEGIYSGKSKTYDFRDKRFCIIMAGNPYTESGDKFQIPDMLANRADIYNLGDVIGESSALFDMSLIENALTSNDTLRQMSSKNMDDMYKIINHVQSKSQDTLALEGNHTKQDIQDCTAVMEKVITVRETLLKVNAEYIRSAAMDDAYRMEPSFKLQGSYRDMNKLVAKLVPIMNEKELSALLLSHYESEAQTLTSAAEANVLKYKEMVGSISEEESRRWDDIKMTFVKNNKLKGFGDQNDMAQVLNQMIDFSSNLEGIKNAIEAGINKQK